MTKAQHIGKVEGLGEVYQVVAPFDKQILAFQEHGIQFPYLVDTQDVVDIRLSGLSQDFSRTSLAPVGTKGENTILYRPLPLMIPLMAISAVNVHRNGQYPEFSRSLYDVVKEIAKNESSKEPEDRTSLILSQKGDFSLTPEMPETRFILGARAKEYFEKNKHGKIQFYDLPNDSKQTVVNYTWFGYPQNGSSLDCRNGCLGNGYGAFGVRKSETDEVSSQKISGYDLTAIKNANSQAIAKYLERKKIGGLVGLFGGLNDVLLEELRSTKQ